MTGNALRHARTVMFSPDNGNRGDAPDVLLVVTDGNAQDRQLLFDEADRLREEEITVRILYFLAMIN